MKTVKVFRLTPPVIAVSALLLVGLVLIQPMPAETPGVAATSPKEGTAAFSSYIITPSGMDLVGDVTVCGDAIGDPTVASWCAGVPTGTIMLGVDPDSPDPDDWDGGEATASFYIDGIISPTVAVLTVSWPDQDGKGLHSPQPYRGAAMTLDGWRLWDKRTLELSTFDDYYAAEHQPILTAIVLTQSVTHTLGFSVSAHTAWDLSRIELATYPYPTTVKGIAYGEIRDCQYPGGESQPSVQDVREDMFRLFHTSNAIRTYSAAGIGAHTVTEANAIGLPVFVGAWLDYPTTTLAQDEAEIQALVDVTCGNDVAGVIVGNEYYLRQRATEAISYLAQRIQQVKSGIDGCGKDVPVTTAEIDNLMFAWDGGDDFEPEINTDYRPILDEVDFIMVHIYPFWNGMPIEGAAAFTVNRYKAIQTLVHDGGNPLAV